MFMNDCPCVIYNMHLDFDIALDYKSYKQKIRSIIIRTLHKSRHCPLQNIEMLRDINSGLQNVNKQFPKCLLQTSFPLSVLF